MIEIEIVSGDLKSGKWQYHDHKLTKNADGMMVIPINEVVELSKVETIGKDHYVKFTLRTKQSFTAKMKEDCYTVLFEDFLKHGNNQQSGEQPTTFDASSDATSSKNSSNKAWLAFGGMFALGLLFASVNSGAKDYTTTQKTKLCKTYISQLFHRPVSIIRFDREDSQGLIYVDYIRRDDNTKWSYVCEIDSRNETMVWAGWLSDSKKWGRWRTEDKVALNYDQKSNATEFKMTTTKELVRVPFN
ncbi:TPA: hypothetical protein O4H64_004117 [Vibrio alginolyticus]|nr:hypothetical protein [Vibrio alginolyticus]